MTSFLINCIFSRNECWELRAADRSQEVLIHRQTHGRSENFHRTKIWNITFFNLKIMIKMRRFASFLSYLAVNNESLGFWTVCWTEEVFWIITVGLLKGQFTQITKRCLLLLSVLLFLVSSQSEFTGFYLVRFLNNHLRRFTCDDWNVTNRTFEVFLLEDFHFLLLHTSTAPRFGEYNAFFFYSITLIC